MIGRPVRLLVLLAVWCAPALAEITPGAPARAPGDLALTIVASDTPDYIREWLATPSSHGVKIRKLRVARPEQLVVVAFLVTGLSGDAQRNYAFSVSFYVLDPNGKAMFGQRDYAGGRGKVRAKPVLTMADPALDMVLEKSDPEGVYTIVAQVQDRVNGKKADAAYRIRFVKSE